MASEVMLIFIFLHLVKPQTLIISLIFFTRFLINCRRELLGNRISPCNQGADADARLV